MNKILTLETNKYSIRLDNFEGPLDLLCHLVDKNKMNIHEVNITKITDQYIQYINAMKELNLDVTSEFILMASTLLYIKSKSLLPKQVEDEGELTEKELIHRIIEYKKYKEISKKLREKFNICSKRFYKLPDKIELPKQKLEIEYSQNIIVDLYRDIIEKNAKRLNQNAKNIEKIAIVENYTVADKVKVMFKELIRKKRFVFNNLFALNKCNKKEVVTAFSGLLELSRRSKVTTNQQEIFGDILVEKVKKNV